MDVILNFGSHARILLRLFHGIYVHTVVQIWWFTTICNFNWNVELPIITEYRAFQWGSAGMLLFDLGEP